MLAQNFRIQSLEDECSRLKIKGEEVNENLVLKETMLDGANNRLDECWKCERCLESQLQEMRTEHDAYKKKAERVLKVRIIICKIYS